MFMLDEKMLQKISQFTHENALIELPVKWWLKVNWN